MRYLFLSLAIVTATGLAASAATAPPWRDAEDPAACSYPADFSVNDGRGAFEVAGLSGPYCSGDLLFAAPSDEGATASITAEADQRLRFGGSFLADVAAGDTFGLVLRDRRETVSDLDADGRGFFDVMVRPGEVFGFFYTVAAGSPGGTLAVDYFAEPPGAGPAPVPVPAAVQLALLAIAALLGLRGTGRGRRIAT